MIVTLDPLLFEPGQATMAELLELFTHAYDGRHRVEIEEDHAAVRAWLDQRDREWRAAWEAARDQGFREATLDMLRRAVRVVPGDRHDLKSVPPTLDVRTALRVLRQPLRVLVENGRNDGGRFLRRASEIGRRSERLKRFLVDGWMEFDSAGGNDEMAEVIESNRANPAWTLRHYAIFDSDALSPGQPSASAQKLLRRCQKSGVPHHCLCRRAAENYLPPAALEYLWAGSKEERLRQVHAYRDLDQPGGRSERRHHFAMKKGFRGSPERPAPVPHDDALYSGVPPERREALAYGFGGSILDVFSTPHADWERWMLDDGQGDEIGGMLDDVFAFR